MTTRGRRPPLAARLAAPLLGLLLTGGPALSRAGPDAVPALPGYRLGTFDPQRLQQGPDARGNWRLNGPADYAYAIERRCYCPAPRRAVVYVLAGRVVRVRDLENGRVSEAPETLRAFHTVQALLEQIDTLLARHPDAVTLEHHRRLGYPTRFRADPSYRVADDETDYRILWLKPLRPARP